MSGAGVDRAAAAADPHAWHAYPLLVPQPASHSGVIVIDDDSCEPELDRARQHLTATATATAAAATPATMKPEPAVGSLFCDEDPRGSRATASANTHCASPHLALPAHDVYKDAEAPATVAMVPAAASSASASNSLTTTVLGPLSSLLALNDSITSAAAAAASAGAALGFQPKSEPIAPQPRYLTRSAKRKQDDLTSGQPKQQCTTRIAATTGGAAVAAFQPLPAASQLFATAPQHNSVSTADAALAAAGRVVDPYYMMVSGDQQPHQPVTWSSAALYQAARAVAAAAAGPPSAASRATRQKAAAAQQQQNLPAPKRRKNAAVTTATAAKPAAPRAARGRAAPRTKQAQ
ncbi:hypothetical protein IWW37_001948 [Coemansia sp. RSA 2050]|nr:hypothetical protein IWW37_001948 [Coemansia sp. RSA 2050]